MNKMLKTLTPMLVVIILLLLFVSHVNFQMHATGWMTTSFAHKLGLVQDDGNSPFSAKRVWFVKNNEVYEFRSAYPIIGSVPFDFFGSGHTNKDLLTECEKVSEESCVKSK